MNITKKRFKRAIIATLLQIICGIFVVGTICAGAYFVAISPKWMIVFVVITFCITALFIINYFVDEKEQL